MIFNFLLVLESLLKVYKGLVEINGNTIVLLHVPNLSPFDKIGSPILLFEYFKHNTC